MEPNNSVSFMWKELLQARDALLNHILLKTRDGNIKVWTDQWILVLPNQRLPSNF